LPRFLPHPTALRRLTTGALCAAGCAAALAAHQPPVPPTCRGGVVLGQIDVSVLDAHRRPVEGLTASDITVLEDGKPRPVVTFVPVTLDAAATPSGGAAWARDVPPDVTTNALRPEGRLVVIMFDWSIRFEDQQLARRIATATIDQLGPDDLAAVVFTSAFASGGTPQNFTADRARLRAAVERPFAMALHNPPVGPGHDPRNGNEVMIDDPEGYESGDCLCRACVPQTIARVADAVRDVQGRRKTLLFIGTYFRSYESLQGPVSRPPAGPPAAVGGIVRPSVFTMACSGPLRDAREKMVRATSLANLTIHTLDPVGIETSLNSPLGGSLQGMRERQADLAVLADLTGGRTVMSTEAPEAQVPALFAESGTYYLIGFTPASPRADGKLHKVDVRVARPDVTVRTVSGYYAADARADEKGRGTRPSGAAAALGGILPRADLPLQVTVAPFASADGPTSTVAVVTGIRQAAPAVAGRPVTVVTAAFDRNGRSVEAQTQTVGVTWRPDRTGTMPYDVLSRLTLEPGRYEIRVAVDAGPNAEASVYSFVDVPDFRKGAVALSGLVLSRVPEGLAAPRDAFDALLPVVPTASRRFAQTDQVGALVRVYQARDSTARPVSLSSRVVDRDDRVRTSGALTLEADRFAGTGAADYRVDLPLAALDRGEYLLTIEAAQGDRTIARHARFHVE
jgi:VWFA-related protein